MPRNCLILGSGRSGTSLTAGIVANAGYFMGGSVPPPGTTEGNPKGQFEDAEINAINEDLLGLAIRSYRHRLFNKLFHRARRRELRLRYSHRWLAAIPCSVRISANPALAERIRKVSESEPFCFKDPRFSYTLQAWRPFVNNALFICVFRHPAVTAASVVSECQRAPYLRGLAMDRDRALRVWEHVYRYVLEVQHRQGGDWLFVHYDQVMDGSALPRIEQALGAAADRTFADPNLRRSKPSGAVSPRLLSLYRRLCNFAGYHG